ncbi:glycosyltransferase family 4 protein [Halobacterium bonnevillei]|uniref:Glycosyltransferase n=1 Tax=Halobacterium bonnevillei TaxID=2692200 RepID=A0A6B0SGL7_9EURY|nr:glycosyltransferase [Halobacterium bonnevillei]MXR19071.1 glycosyltransferase [Halobacterium bonnevillei]
MDILLITGDFYPITAGGAFEDTEVAKYANEQGHNVTVFTFKLDDSPRRELYQGIDVRRPIQPPFIQASIGSIRSNLGRLFASFVLFLYVLKYSFSENSDVIYSTNHSVHWVSKVVGDFINSPVVTIVSYTPSLDKSNKNITNMSYLLEQLNFRFFMGKFIHCRTPQIRDDIKAIKSNTPVQVTHGIVNKERVREAADSLPTEPGWEKTEFDINSQNHVLLFVGRLVPLKNPKIAIDVFSELPDNFELIIIGDGPEMYATKNYAKTIISKEKIHFAGEISHVETLQTMLLADALVLTSTTESYGAVVFEALSCSSYVVAPRIGILPSLSDDIECLKLSPPKGMAKKIQDMNMSSSQRKVNSKLMEKYSIENFADDVCTSFEKVVDNR